MRARRSDHRGTAVAVTVTAALAGALASALACAPLADREHLQGTYVLSIATDTLRLEPSGRYRRVFIYDGTPRRTVVDTGEWRVAAKGRMIALRGLPSRWPEHGYNPGTGAWHTPDTTVRRTVSLVVGTTWTLRLTLAVKPELGWRYERIRTRQ